MNAPRFHPPKNFRPSDGAYAVEFIPPPSFATASARLKGAAGRGMAYERKVHVHLSKRFGPDQGGALYAPARWIAFHTPLSPREFRLAQPDGILIDLARNLIIIIEVKLRHTQNAWWGLRRLYEPLIRAMFPDWQIAVCEVVYWYDPAVFWPEKLTLVRDPSLLRAGEFGAMILSPSMMRDQELASLAALPHFPVGLPHG